MLSAFAPFTHTHPRTYLQEILVTGHGKGKSSAPHQFIADVNKYAPKLARKVVGILPIDEKHVTENQLLAAAAHFYENRNL